MRLRYAGAMMIHRAGAGDGTSAREDYYEERRAELPATPAAAAYGISCARLRHLPLQHTGASGLRLTTTFISMNILAARQ